MARGLKKGYRNPMKGIKRGSEQYWSVQYDTYLKKRQSLIDKGTRLNKKFTKDEFKSQYSLLKSEKSKNIISKLVKAQELITYQDAITLYENKNDIKFNPFSRKEREAVSKIYNFEPDETDIMKAEKIYMHKNKHGFREGKDYSDYIYFMTMIEMGYDRDELEKNYGY